MVYLLFITFRKCHDFLKCLLQAVVLQDGLCVGQTSSIPDPEQIQGHSQTAGTCPSSMSSNGALGLSFPNP